MDDDRAPLEQAERTVRSIGQLIGDACPQGWLFALVMATAGDEGLMTYLSNANRSDMVKLLREMADKIESGDPNV